MRGLIDAALANPWTTLDTVLEGPLHPGGHEATDALLDRATVDSGTRLLDVGCGAGDALALARERGATAWGIDPDPDADRAIRGDGAHLPFDAESVDVVLAECVLCLTTLDDALAETHRVLAPGGRLALSDVVVASDAPAVPERLATALCLTGARRREELRASVERAGFEISTVRDHREDLLAMRDRVTERIDYEGLLGTMGERAEDALAAIEALEAAVEDGRVGYVSVVASK